MRGSSGWIIIISSSCWCVVRVVRLVLFSGVLVMRVRVRACVSSVVCAGRIVRSFGILRMREEEARVSHDFSLEQNFFTAESLHSGSRME